MKPTTQTRKKNIHFIKHFSQLFRNNPKKRIFTIYGGAGSGKSFSVAQHICKLLCEGPGYNILVVRKTLPALRITAYQLILEILNDWGIPYLHNKTLRTVTVGPNQVYFTGIDDPEKIKSSEYNFIWVEEASEIEKKTFLQLNLRLRKKNTAGRLNQMFLTFNPIDAFHWLQKEIIEAPPNEKIVIHHSTYLDNPFLDPEYVTELKNLELLDPNFYRIYTLGLPGVLSNQIYKNYIIEPSPKAAGYLPMTADAMGLDFGFNNQTALVAVRYYEGRLYLKELLYVKGYTNTDLINWMKTHLPNSSIPLYCDNAEPARIEEICQAGFNAWPARKEVVPGIDFLKAQQLVLDPESPNLIEEFRNYKWREDKEGRVLDEPVKFRDHTCFIAGTMIQTIDGPRPIETITPGTMVLTRRGYYPVIAAGKTGQADSLIKVTFSDGQTLTGTPEHPIYVVEKGWVALRNVRNNDKVLSVYNNVWQKSRKSYIMKFFSEDTHSRKTEATEFITGPTPNILETASGTYTRKSGKPKMAQSRPGIAYITRTATHLITALKTLNVLKIKSTDQNIQKDSLKTNLLGRPIRSTLKRSKKAPINGIVPKPAKPFIKDTEPGFMRPVSQLRRFVTSAARKWKTSAQGEINDSVLENAARYGGGSTRRKKSAPARYAGSLSRLLREVKPGHVLRVVKTNSPEGITGGHITDVYNLTVSTFHEYYANGILCKNCDAARYAIFTMGLGEVPVSVEVLGKGKSIPGMRSQFKETGAVDLEFDDEDLPDDWGDVTEIPGL